MTHNRVWWFHQATEVFGSDGDQPPSFGEQMAAKIGKTMDKNFIDKRRPQPVRLPRTLVYKPFAVLLMRSCYDAVDDLNFVPMDQFQREFFLLRQNEWEKYLAENDCKQVLLRRGSQPAGPFHPKVTSRRHERDSSESLNWCCTAGRSLRPDVLRLHFCSAIW